LKKAFIIGIGAGDPDYVTIQAVKALNQVDVFFIADKGAEKGDLNRLRREICDRFIEDKRFRVVEFQPPARITQSAPYRAGIELCNEELEASYEKLLIEEVAEGQCAGFLVWGDPALYDSTMRILARIQAKGRFDFDYEVIPGISSIQALTAKHKIPLNRIGEAVHITTGRKLAEGYPDNAQSVVVMLDSGCAFRNVPNKDLDIYWGAYIGTEDEILIAGKLGDVSDEIERRRSAARQRKGWTMDTYLMRKGTP
jgi:precorrin-6A synthase